jgi:hypothetical protein
MLSCARTYLMLIFQFFFSSNANQLLDLKVDCVAVNNGDAADAKFKSKGAEANGGGDDLFDAEDLKGEVGAAFDQASCIVICI